MKISIHTLGLDGHIPFLCSQNVLRKDRIDLRHGGTQDDAGCTAQGSGSVWAITESYFAFAGATPAMP